MSTEIENLEDELIEALHSLSLDARSFDVVLWELERLESNIVATLIQRDAEKLVESARRSIAAAALSIATDKCADANTALALFERSSRLGYETPEQRLVAAALFARLCLNNGTAGLVVQELAVQELEEALRHAVVPSELTKGFKALYDELRARSSR